jgi:predicted GH43/DUF377 family glycosyl hydrolase
MKALTLALFLLLPIFLFAQTDIVKYSGNPVLNVGPEGSWDEKVVVEPCVIVDGDTYKMWYAGYDNSNYRIGYATSLDGINWTKADSVNPVLDLGPEGSWDDESVNFPCVLYDGNIYKMWYCGYHGINYRIGYATSLDGINWTKADSVNPVLDVGSEGQWDDYWLTTPRVIFLENEYIMFYSGMIQNFHASIGCAKSPDGIVWTKAEDHNPVLVASDNWESTQLFVGSVLFIDDILKMWYVGGSLGSKIRSGYAISEDGLSWNKYETYVLDYGDDSGVWDYKFATVRSVYFNGKSYQIWYDCKNHYAAGGSNGAIGYATSDTTVGIAREIVIPEVYELSQNYPNPFNPSTIIKYDIPNESNVILKVFDVLGREVTTLVNKQQKAGYYEVSWNAVNNSSGVYFYKIQVYPASGVGDPAKGAGQGFVETKKMLLLR